MAINYSNFISRHDYYSVKNKQSRETNIRPFYNNIISPRPFKNTFCKAKNVVLNAEYSLVRQ